MNNEQTQTAMNNVEVAKAELSNVNFQSLIQAACKEFTDACFDEGLTADKARQLMLSAEGLEVIAKLAAKRI